MNDNINTLESNYSTMNDNVNSYLVSLQSDVTVLYNIYKKGMILMWSGLLSKIPTGWVLCDGNNGTPDLRNKFIIGAGSTYAIGASQNQNANVGDTVLNEQQIPNHWHYIANDSGTKGDYSGNNGRGTYAGYINETNASWGLAASKQSVYPNIGKTSGVNGNQSYSTNSHTHSLPLPPYYALAYIMKT